MKDREMHGMMGPRTWSVAPNKSARMMVGKTCHKDADSCHKSNISNHSMAENTRNLILTGLSHSKSIPGRNGVVFIFLMHYPAL